MAWETASKEIINNILTDITSLQENNEIPAQDSSDNILIRDAVGGKTDTTEGNSVVSLIKTNFKEIEYAEHHLHHKSKTYGKSADQSGNNWATENVFTPYVAISGAGDFGSDSNDEAKVFGSEDTPVWPGQEFFDPGEIIVTNVSNDNLFLIRIAWGIGTLSEAIAAGQYSTKPAKFDSTNPQVTANTSVILSTEKLAVGTKVWVQIKNGTNNATINFFVDAHGY